MKILLADMAQIQTGIFVRLAPEMKACYLQAKHFDETGALVASLFPELDTREIAERHLLRGGDVLFCAKSAKNFATVVQKEWLPAVASTSFFVIRTTNYLNPDFLAWWLNHPVTMASLKSQALGTSLPSISKSVLESVEILLPDHAVQNTILAVTHLRKQEKQLQQRLDALREMQVQHTIFQSLKK